MSRADATPYCHISSAARLNGFGLAPALTAAKAAWATHFVAFLWIGRVEIEDTGVE
jgi:hypothetical protein